MNEYIEHLENAREAFKKYGNLLKISAEDTDADKDIYLAEEICIEEMDSIMELIDSLMEKAILKQKIALKG